jgi:hypothetical protein
MSLLSQLLDFLYSFIQLFKYKDYTIRRVQLEYTVIKNEGSMTGEFWSSQQKNWNLLPDIFTVDVKDHIFLPLPECVQDPILKISYIFNSREYMYATSDMKYSWPPKKTTTMQFVLPYKQAVLLNSDDVPVKNITEQFNQCAGPRFDFHGAPVPLSSMIGKPFTKIRVTNIMNQQSIVDLCS